jgi:hypothetical protein
MDVGLAFQFSKIKNERNPMEIRKYVTNGDGYIRAEIQWLKDDLSLAGDTKTFEVASGGFAELTVLQEEHCITLSIVPGNVVLYDKIQLPIKPGIKLPKKVIGANFPSCYFYLPYIISPLDDTIYGFALSVGLITDESDTP